MKVKFDLIEDVRLKAYYFLRLRDKLGEPPLDDCFDVCINKLASSALIHYLDEMISSYEDNLYIQGRRNFNEAQDV